MDHPARRFYGRQLLYSGIAEIKRLHARFPELGPARVQSVGSLLDLDRVYTAPRNGFDRVESYHERSSPIGTLARIEVPGLFVHAEDDPFLPIEPVQRARFAPTMIVEVYPRGGHLGFISRTPWSGDRRWLLTRMAAWLADRWGLPLRT